MLRSTLRRVQNWIRPAPPTDYNALHVGRAASYCDPAGRRVFVVGCNRGEDCQRFMRLGALEVHGVDVIEDIGAAFEHRRAHYHRMSVEAMDLPANAFDLVFCFATMEHVPRIAAAFAEMARVTAPGGYVYSVASPLWHSRYGHHKAELFRDDPWIHLRMEQDEIVAYGLAKGLDAPPGLAHHVSFMLNPKYFNKLPARAYIEACAGLPDMRPVANTLDCEPEEALPATILDELSRKGYDSEELRAVTHTYIGQKLA